MSSLDHLPDVRDGLTAIERQVLAEVPAADAAAEICQPIITRVVRRWHEHPARELYGALVQMTQPFKSRYPLIQGEGAFGSAEGGPVEGSTKTRAHRSQAGQALVGPNGVPVPDTRSAVARARAGASRPALTGPFPSLLVNGSWEGLSSLPPHNLGEVAAAIAARIDDPTMDLDGLLQYLPGPDFATGGTVLDRGALREAYATGRGTIHVRADSSPSDDPRDSRDSTFTVLGIVLVGDQPQQQGLLDLVDGYIEHQRASRIAANPEAAVDVDAAIKRDLAELVGQLGDPRRTTIPGALR